MTVSTATADNCDLATWQHLHRTLHNAVRVAQEQVDIQKAQKRYWMEEIAAHIQADGTLQPHSSWRKTRIGGNTKKTVSGVSLPLPNNKRKIVETTKSVLETATGPLRPSKKPKPVEETTAGVALKTTPDTATIVEKAETSPFTSNLDLMAAVAFAAEKSESTSTVTKPKTTFASLEEIADDDESDQERIF